MYTDLKMDIDIRFNRKLTKEDYVIPGRYEMVFSGRSVQFDFQDYCGTIDNDDPTLLHCELKHPDFNAFEDFQTITSVQKDPNFNCFAVTYERKLLCVKK